MNLADFESTVVHSRDRVFGYAIRLVGDRDLAADLVQDAMMKLWTHRDQIERAGALSWLLKVTRNGCLDALRRRGFESKHFVAGEDPESLSASPGSTDQLAEQRVLRRHLDRAIARLSEPQRSIVLLREVEGFRYDEISGALDLPLNTVKVYLHRGRAALRTSILEELQGEPV